MLKKVKSQATARKEAAHDAAKKEILAIIARALEACGSREALAAACCTTTAAVHIWEQGIHYPGAVPLLTMQKLGVLG